MVFGPLSPISAQTIRCHAFESSDLLCSRPMCYSELGARFFVRIWPPVCALDGDLTSRQDTLVQTFVLSSATVSEIVAHKSQNLPPPEKDQQLLSYLFVQDSFKSLQLACNSLSTVHGQHDAQGAPECGSTVGLNHTPHSGTTRIPA